MARHAFVGLTGHLLVAIPADLPRTRSQKTEPAGLYACLETLIVVALDRISSSTANVIASMETLGKCGIGFKSLCGPMFDTTPPRLENSCSPCSPVSHSSSAG